MKQKIAYSIMEVCGVLLIVVFGGVLTYNYITHKTPQYNNSTLGCTGICVPIVTHKYYGIDLGISGVSGVPLNNTTIPTRSIEDYGFEKVLQ